MPSSCRRCHKVGHLYKEFPLVTYATSPIKDLAVAAQDAPPSAEGLTSRSQGWKSTYYRMTHIPTLSSPKPASPPMTRSWADAMVAHSLGTSSPFFSTSSFISFVSTEHLHVSLASILNISSSHYHALQMSTLNLSPPLLPLSLAWILFLPQISQPPLITHNLTTYTPKNLTPHSSWDWVDLSSQIYQDFKGQALLHIQGNHTGKGGCGYGLEKHTREGT